MTARSTPNSAETANRILNLIPDDAVIPLDRAFGILREIRALCKETVASQASDIAHAANVIGSD